MITENRCALPSLHPFNSEAAFYINPHNHVNPVKHAFHVGRFYRIYRIGHDLHDHGHAKESWIHWSQV